MRLRWIAIGAIVLVAAGGFYYLRRPKEKAPEYRTARVERGTITATITATGTLKPVTMVQVGSQVSGTILSLHADFNSTVKRGQLVAQLDPSFYRSQLAQADANLARAEVNVTDAERTFKRSQELMSRGLISQAEVDGNEAALDRSRAELRQARASVDQSRVNLDHTTITSPIDGVVVSRNVDVGQTVAASLQAPVLFEIANDLTAMQVEASIDEADIGQVQVGQMAHFTVDAFPDAPFTGTVAQIRLQAITVQNVVTYTTVIAVPNPDLKLRPGMTANVTVDVAKRDDVIKIPAAALSFKMATKPEKAGRNSAAAREPAAGAGPRADSSGSPAGGRRGRPGHGMGDSLHAGRAGDSLRAGGRWSGESSGAPGDGGRGNWNGGGGGAGGGGWNGGGSGRGGRGGQTVYVVVPGGEPRPVTVRTGITDGYFTELTRGELREGEEVIVGLVGASASAGGNGPPGGGRSPLTQRRGPF